MAKATVGPKQVTSDKKVLLVEIDDIGIPRFKFEGKWLGKEVFTVQALLHRAYLKHQRDIRLKETLNKEDK